MTCFRYKIYNLMSDGSKNKYLDMPHNPPDCQLEYKKDGDEKARTYCLTHGAVPVCNVCHNNKEAHYIGSKLSHTSDEYEKAESEIEGMIGIGELIKKHPNLRKKSSIKTQDMVDALNRGVMKDDEKPS